MIQWKLVYISCGLKGLKNAIVTYPTIHALEDGTLWMRYFWKKLLNWIHTKATTIWRKIFACHVQLSVNISSELGNLQRETRFVMNFRLRIETQCSIICSNCFLLTKNTTFYFYNLLLQVMKNVLCMSTEKKKLVVITKWESNANTKTRISSTEVLAWCLGKYKRYRLTRAVGTWKDHLYTLMLLATWSCKRSITTKVYCFGKKVTKIF